MTQIQHIDDIALSSAFPTDKIVKVLTGSFNTGTSARQKDNLGNDVYAMLAISHGFTRPVFTKMKWSLDQVTWVDGGIAQLESDPLIQCITYSDSGSVVLLSTELSRTVYYEIICFWIDDYDGTNPLVDAYSNATKDIAFDSRLNYQKIIAQGEVSFTGLSDTESINHELGKIPNAWLFFESNPGQVWPAILGGIDNVWLYNYDTQGEIEYSITDHSVNIEWSAGASFVGSARLWYRIYGEGS